MAFARAGPRLYVYDFRTTPSCSMERVLTGPAGRCNELIIAVAQSWGSHVWSGALCCEMRAGGGVGAGALGVDLRFVFLNGGHYLGLPHVVHGLLHFGGGGWKLVAETLVERFFGLQG